jgi:hypothetical protein
MRIGGTFFVFSELILFLQDDLASFTSGFEDIPSVVELPDSTMPTKSLEGSY